MQPNFGIKLIDGNDLTVDGKETFFIFVTSLGEYHPINYEMAVKALSNMRIDKPDGIHIVKKDQQIQTSIEYYPYDKIRNIYKIDQFLQTPKL